MILGATFNSRAKHKGTEARKKTARGCRNLEESIASRIRKTIDVCHDENLDG